MEPIGAIIASLIIFNVIIAIVQLDLCYYKPKYALIELYFKSKWISVLIWLYNSIGISIILLF